MAKWYTYDACTELEATLKALESALKVQQNQGKKGMIVNKGKANEIKITYDQARDCVYKMRLHFGAMGSLTLGCCDTCIHGSFNKNSIKGFSGKCRRTGHNVDCYTSCTKHTKRGAKK